MKKLCLLSIFILQFISYANAMPNPASVNCVNKGNKLVLMNNTGICIFKDKSYCEEWAYFRKTCRPKQNFLPHQFSTKNLKQFCIQRSDENVYVVVCKNHRQ